tara:strand:+ start:3915 stop:4082 length:168 start_codon:yes stop_codon:yes gene_type:complete
LGGGKLFRGNADGISTTFHFTKVEINFSKTRALKKIINKNYITTCFLELYTVKKI